MYYWDSLLYGHKRAVELATNRLNRILKGEGVGPADPGTKTQLMNKTFDELITWGGLHNNPHSAKVRVQIFDQVTTAGSSGRRKVIILTEPEDNHGTSVTNGVEQIATRVLRDHGIDFHSVQFVEHSGSFADARIRMRIGPFRVHA